MKKLTLLSLFVAACFGQSTAPALTNAAVLNMLHNNVPASVVIQTINSREYSPSFNLDPGSLDVMTKAGVPEEVIKAMAARQAGRGFVTAAYPSAAADSQKPKRAPYYSDHPTADVYGGYSFLNIDTNGLSARQNANGWEASTTVYATNWLGVEGNVSGYYKDYGEIGVRDYSFLAGPRVIFKRAFVHALFGGDDLIGSAFGLSASQTGFAMAFGGGVDVKVSGHWSIRPTADYVVSWHNIVGYQRVSQNNFRVGAGIVYTFGSLM